MNGDGKLEVLLGCYSGVRIFLGSEDNRIEYHGQSSVNGFAEGLPSINYFDVADITGDDRDDIVALNHFFGNGLVGDQGFSLSMYQFDRANVSVENTVETQPGGGLNILGFQLRAEDGSVAEEELITSHVYKAGKNLGIEVYGSSLAANAYEYKVKPYFYWSKSGALVVDYMIDLSQGPFWQDNYGTQDPGFILPNRLDSLKAKNEIDKIKDLDEYLKTPSILFDPAIPVNGDTVSVTTIVHNLSLSPTSDPVEVSFYLGDPDKGVRLISDVEGRSVFTTDEVIEDQNYAIFDFRWKAKFERFDRMYALIDPAGKLVEKRLDNNKAWSPVQRFGACGDPLSAEQIPVQALRFEDRLSIYPNPAYSFVNLEYDGSDISDVVISISDLSGKIYRIEALSFAEMNYSSGFDVSGLEQGIYILGLSTSNYQQHTKLVIE